MSLSDLQSIGSNNNGAHVFTKTAQAGTSAFFTETGVASPRLQFNSLTLDELSEELDRRTKETQRLQEEVEYATKTALERFGCTYGIPSSPTASCHNHKLNGYDSPGGSTIISIQQQTVSQPLLCDLDSLNRGNISSPGKDVLENTIDDCLHQLCDLQINKKHDQPGQEGLMTDKAIMKLEAKLHKIQKENEILSDLRLKDSRTHVDQMEKMLSMLEELQNIKRAENQKLQETEDEVLGVRTSPQQLSPTAKLTTDSDNERDELQGRISLQSLKHLRSGESSDVHKQNKRMEDLIASLGQEMEQLTDKLGSSKLNSDSLSVKLELLKKLTERQISLHRCQVSELESTLDSHKDKVCCLEQQLIHTQSLLVGAQRERERSSQQAEELQSQLVQFKRCSERQQCELQEEAKALRGKLEAARKETACLQALLEQRDQEGRKSQEELQLRRHEAQHHLARLEEAQSRCQTLHAEGETLKLKLDGERMLESRIQMQSHIIDDLHQENSLLSNQKNQHKLEIQQLRAELDRHRSDLAAAEHERRRLQASVNEQSQRIQEETLEKQQLTIQLEVQLMQLLTLTKEHKELQQIHSCKNEEHEGVVLKLQSQLRNAQDELDQVRSSLRSLQGAEGHGLQVAMDMQKEITARREQVDSLQGKIQHLEEIRDKLYQEKRYQSLENQRQLQQITFVREEKRQLGSELEALRSKDKQLRVRISQLEAVLHKMTEGFADCQDFIQLQEQDFFRLKLQHALNLKELKGQNVHPALDLLPPDVDSPSPSVLTAPPCSQHDSSTQQKESPTQELRSVVKELRRVISENHRPHTDDRRRSEPERVHRTTFTTDLEDKAGSRLRRKTCGSEPRFLKAAELNRKTISSKTFSESRVILGSSPKQLSLDRRSPVHILLTSDPNITVT